MRIVLDTNVLISGIFFSGPPHQILKAWRRGQVQILISPAILEEYGKVANQLASQFKSIDIVPLLELVTVYSEMVLAKEMPLAISEDPSDQKFLECAVSGKADAIVSGDKHLVKMGRFQNIPIYRPRNFIERLK